MTRWRKRGSLFGSCGRQHATGFGLHGVGLVLWARCIELCQIPLLLSASFFCIFAFIKVQTLGGRISRVTGVAVGWDGFRAVSATIRLSCNNNRSCKALRDGIHVGVGVVYGAGYKSQHLSNLRGQTDVWLHDSIGKGSYIKYGDEFDRHGYERQRRPPQPYINDQPSLSDSSASG